MLSLNIYKFIEGQDEWPLVEIITGDTVQECFDKAESKYDIELYHWSNPY